MAFYMIKSHACNLTDSSETWTLKSAKTRNCLKCARPFSPTHVRTVMWMVNGRIYDDIQSHFFCGVPRRMYVQCVPDSFSSSVQRALCGVCVCVCVCVTVHNIVCWVTMQKPASFTGRYRIAQNFRWIKILLNTHTLYRHKISLTLISPTVRVAHQEVVGGALEWTRHAQILYYVTAYFPTCILIFIFSSYLKCIHCFLVSLALACCTPFTAALASAMAEGDSSDDRGPARCNVEVRQ